MPLQFIAQAYAAPTGGQVVAGTANIAQAGNITDIHQSSQNAAINWQDFSIKATETVNFHQPNHEAVTLNRVLGNEKSVIDGMMNASGKVFIQNPNGTLIGKNAQINVGGLVATTAKISDDDFMRGDYRFKHGTAGDITNLGQITVPKGGVVALIAPIVKNQGTITAHEANVLLASADSFSITLPDNVNFAYTLDKGTLQGLVDNGGAILADGGRVVLTTLGIDTVKKSIIKHTGLIEANSVQNNNGVIEFVGDEHSTITTTGTLNAKAGTIRQKASQVQLAGTTKLNITDGQLSLQADRLNVGGQDGHISGGQISQALRQGDVTLISDDQRDENSGIYINNPIVWNKHKLTLTADNDIHINKTLSGTGTAKLALEYGQGTVDGGESDYYLDKDTPLASRTVTVNLPAGKNLSLKKGSGSTVEVFDVIHEMPAITKNGHGEWESKFTTDKIAFGADIDVSHTHNHKGFAGWELPRDGAKVHGLGHVANGLWLRSKKSSQPTGLFQSNGHNGEFRDIGVTHVNISSEGYNSPAGGLVGRGNYIYNSYATGNVSTTGKDAHAGGLVGYGGGIYNSYATGNILAIGEYADAGGLVGNGSVIFNSYATGDVLAAGWIGRAGGLVGKGAHIYNSHATGNVSTTGDSGDAGGLVGFVDSRHIHNGYDIGSVSSSYATGNVSTTGDSGSAGGLVARGG